MDKASEIAIADIDYVYLVQDILNNQSFLELLKFNHHRNSTRLDHCIHVSYSCYKHYMRAKGRYKYIKEMVRGALLHDFFLYDYSAERSLKKHWFHGYFHPKASLITAEREFSLSKIEKNIILRHMFPLTLIPPVCRAAWWVVFYDKLWALKEIFCKL